MLVVAQGKDSKNFVHCMGIVVGCVLVPVENWCGWVRMD